jgi:hypothetical protein
VDTLYESYLYPVNPGSEATFMVFSRDVAPFTEWTMRILDGQGIIVDSWTYANNSTPRRSSSIGWFRQLPVQAGTYTYETTFNGITCGTQFEITDVTGSAGIDPMSVRPYPVPAADELRIDMGPDVSLRMAVLTDMMGRKLADWTRSVNGTWTTDVCHLQPGLYAYLMSTNDGLDLRGTVVVAR